MLSTYKTGRKKHFVEPIPVPQCDPSELSWAAGFFDGEGYTSSIKDRHVRINISQVEREPLERFQKAVGGLGRILGPYKHKNRITPSGGEWKPIYAYGASGVEETTAVLALLWPYLSTPKREQAIRVCGRVGANRS